MARQIFLHQLTTSTQPVGLSLIGLLLCGIALFMCASHSRKWRRWKACYGSYDEGPVIDLNADPTVLATNGPYGLHSRSIDESMFSAEQQRSGPVWQKNILMGGKCQLPDFSGVIIYDSDGKAVTPAKNQRPLLTWK